MTAPRKAAAWVIIATAAVASFEGLRTAAYLDPVGIPTVCFGETRGVHLGDRYSADECKRLLGERLLQFNREVDACVRVPMSPARRAAVVSFAYNFGAERFCASTFARMLNADDPRACDELLRWTKAAGVVWPGLVRRRAEERKLCME